MTGVTKEVAARREAKKLLVGTKYDQGKLRWDLLPPEFEEVVKVIGYGATKYEDRNWEKGIAYSRFISASFRHIFAWIKGERSDPETGLHHLAHATCCLLFLLTYEMRRMEQFDDRAGKREGSLATGRDGLQPDLFSLQIKETGLQLARSNGFTQGVATASHPYAQYIIEGQPDYYAHSPSSCEPPYDREES
jgi:hypothetical protein